MLQELTLPVGRSCPCTLCPGQSSSSWTQQFRRLQPSLLQEAWKSLFASDAHFVSHSHMRESANGPCVIQRPGWGSRGGDTRLITYTLDEVLLLGRWGHHEMDVDASSLISSWDHDVFQPARLVERHEEDHLLFGSRLEEHQTIA